uniref:DUF58 domain-containing protein n=1 Tax=Ignisphaera aggregans TaxID=334771 RepID=A0A7J3I6R3_9CREN
MKATFTSVVHLSISIMMLFYAFLSRNAFSLVLSLAMILIYYNEYKSFEDADRSIGKLKITRTINRTVCSELEYIEVTINIVNQGSRAIPRMMIVDVPPKYIKPENGKAKFDVTVLQGSSIEITYRARVLAPGTHDFNELVLTVSDALNYFYSEYRFNIRTTVVALPLSIPIKIDIESLQRLLSIRTKGKAIGGAYNIANIRDYTPGDDIRRIIWKVYARTGRLMVREDYGEAKARTLILIDIKKYMWNIGEEPNTLAHIQLRYARSLIEYIARNGATIDASICSGIIPKVVESVNTALVESLYRIFSVLDSGGGCESTIEVYTQVPGYLGRVASDYDAVVLITNLITLALEGSIALEELLKVFNGKLVIVVLEDGTREFIGVDKAELFVRSLIEVAERGGARIELPSESFRVDLRWLK